jgi:beta-galactosidase
MSPRPDQTHAESTGAGPTRRAVLGAAAVAVGTAAAATAFGSSAAAETPSQSRSPRWSRHERSFDENWLFFRGDASGAEAPQFDDRSWQQLDLPHDWSIQDLPDAPSIDGGATADPSTMAFQTTPPPAGTPTKIGPFDQSASAGGSSTGYTVSGIGWYRKSFTFPGVARQMGSRVELRFDGVFHNATVWLNGVQLGTHAYGYTPFSFDLTPHLHAGTNVIAVKVDNTVPDARWYSGSGIYRHTWLTITGPVRIPNYGVFLTTPSVARSRSTVEAAVDIANYASTTVQVQARVTLFAPSGRKVATAKSTAVQVAPATTETVSVDLEVHDCALWSPDNPKLYVARTDLLVDGRTVDTVRTNFGIRDLRWDKDSGLLINGQQVKVRGGCLHAGYGPLGAVALDRAVERQVEILKSSGFNSIRTAHNPPAPYLLDVCDRMGIVVWDEAFDHWSGYTASPDYVADLTTFIRRDRNHPSVVIWSTGNEVNDPTTGKQFHDIVKSLDTTRPATQGATPFDSAADPQYEYVDVSDVHYDFTDKASIRAKYPDRPMTQSESWPATIYDDWQVALDNSWFVGSWVWAAWDYMGESGAGATITAPPGSTELPVFGTGPFPWFLDYQGDIDFIGQRKPQNYWRSVVYGLSPIELLVERPAPAGLQQYANNWSYYDELQSWTWDVPAGQAMTVHAYTSGDSVTLTLNGTPISTVTLTAADKRVATFTVPYAPGTLRAVARKSGRTIGTKSLSTTAAAHAVRLTPDVKRLTTSQDDLAHILVEIVDRHGNRLPDAVTKVSFDVRGAGRLVATGNGNPHNMDSFQQPHRYTWHGQALAILRPAKHEGALTINATADGLRPDRAHISVR